MAQDVDEAISSPKGEIKVTNEVIRYDSTGQTDQFSGSKFSDQQTAAVKVIGRDNIYKVKSQGDGHFFNPINNSFTYGLDKLDRRTNDYLFTLKEVSQKAFTNYIKFLETRNDSLLNVAERG